MADYEGSGFGQPLPTPGDTPHETPSPMSRRSSRQITSRAPSPSRPPLPDDGRRNSHNPSTNEHISILDPRRFTPTLHASLVSEILSLRNELESKHRFIDDLESSLHNAETENEILTRKISNSNKESRNAKRQLQQLENGTLAALEELAKDRDEKNKSCEEMKETIARLEKRVKSLDDDASRRQKLWDHDRERLDSHSRTLERRAHVSEARLKSLLAELASAHEGRNEQQRSHESDDEGTRDSGLGNDSDTNSIRSIGPNRIPANRKTGHSRNMSSASQRSLHRGYRLSTQSDIAGKPSGLSLADELVLDGEDEEALGEMDKDEEEDPTEHVRAQRVLSSRRSYRSDSEAKRVLGLATDKMPPPTANESRSVPTTFLDSPDHDDSPEKLSGDSGSNEKNTAASTMLSRPSRTFEYVDAGVQFSPPHSPQLAPAGNEQARFFCDDLTDRTRRNRTQLLASDTTEIGIHRRLHSIDSTSAAGTSSLIQSMVSTIASGDTTSGMEIPLLLNAKAMTISTLERPAVIMVSTSVQTAEGPLSPPAPKVSQLPLLDFVYAEETKKPRSFTSTQPVASISTSTQTDPLEELRPLGEPLGPLVRRNKPQLFLVPSIAIHPPASAPGSPKETILPPGTKNMSTQTMTEDLISMRSISIQTDEIRVDQRLMKLPAHLRPSAIHSTPIRQFTRPQASNQSITQDSIDELSGPQAGSRQVSEKSLGKSPLTRPGSMLMSDSETETEVRYPGNNDNGPLKNGIAQGQGPGKQEGIRRPFRAGSLFAGFDSDNNDDKDQDEEDEPLPEPRFAPPPFITSSVQKRRLPKLHGVRAHPKPPTPVPEENEVGSRASSESARKRASGSRVQARNSYENARVSKRSSSIRRSALIKGGSNAHARQARSPTSQNATSSIGSSSHGAGAIPPPPFPIPNRLSSRNLVSSSKSDGASSPTPETGRIYQFARRNKRGQHMARNEGIRKVKSAAVISRHSEEMSRSISPPAPLRDLGRPPLPQDAVVRPRYAYASHRVSDSLQTPVTTTEMVSEGSQNSVVDAIAATMVGEWMWKYVRRRKSFNVADPTEGLTGPVQDGSVNVTGNGVRHKRWVWISPYERTVMWSSKQPASGNALLGKNGRKLLIQSVLDVKDDTPLPRGSPIQPFSRSILILTPARALKLTAISQERHYLWLTALSFLANSVVGTPELSTVPLVPQVEPESALALPSSFSRRAAIRDSVRLVKDRKRSSALSGLTGSRETLSRKGAPTMLGPTVKTEHPISDAADAPTIARYTYNHGRKRSTTGPRIPPAPATLRDFSSPAILSASHSLRSVSASIDSDGPSGYGFGSPSRSDSLYCNQSVVASGRTSRAANAGARSPTFADPLGTMRMEAFVARRPHGDATGVTSSALRGGAPAKMRTGACRPRGNTHWSGVGTDPRRSGIVIMDEFEKFDPFKGF